MKYRPEIDGLRAVAVLSVIVFHAGFESFSGGFVGVDVFFVISGFLITSIMINDFENNCFSFADFYERRARRILPALFFVLVSCIPIALWSMAPGDLKEFFQSLISVVIFSSNFLYWSGSGYFDTASELKPLLHTWSLAIEEQYYLLFPFFLAAFWHKGRNRVYWVVCVVFGISFVIACVGTFYAPSAAFFMLPARAWELFSGVIAALVLNARPELRNEVGKTVSEALSLLGLILIGYAVFVFDDKDALLGLPALIPVCGAFLVIVFGGKSGLAGHFLTFKPIVGVGLVSYSAYLWHQPLMAFSRHTLPQEPDKWVMIILCLVTLVMGYVSWRFVEKPFRNKAKFERKLIFQWFGIGSLAVVLFAMFGLGSDDYLSRFKFADVDVDQRKPVCLKSNFRGPGCLIGNSSSNVSFMIFGDSHGLTLSNVLSRELDGTDLQGIDLTIGGCLPTIRGRDKDENEGRRKCDIAREWFYSNLSGETIPKTIILYARWSIYSQRSRYDNEEGGVGYGRKITYYPEENYLSDAMNDYVLSVKKILDSGRDVILVYPTPELGWNLPKRLMKLHANGNQLDEMSGAVKSSGYTKRNKAVISAFDSLGDVQGLARIKPQEWMCDFSEQGRCTAYRDGKALYFDSNHLSMEGVRPIAEKIKEILGR